jgi:hypothetical protein
MNGPARYPFDLSIVGRAMNYSCPWDPGPCKVEPFDDGGRVYLFLECVQPDFGIRWSRPLG